MRHVPEQSGPPSSGVANGALAATEQLEIVSRVGIAAGGTLIGRALGLVRDQVIAAVFPRAATDAWNVALTIPDTLRQAFDQAAVQAVVLPVLSQVREREGEAAARRVFRALRGLSLSVLTSVVVLGVVFAPSLVELFASGLRQHPSQLERTTTLARWIFPYILCTGTAALSLAALHAHGRFVATSLGSALLNVGFIAFALLLPDWLGARGYDPVLALALGGLAGAGLQVVVQWPSLRAIGYLERPTLDLRLPAVRTAMARMRPVLLGMGLYYGQVLIARRLLSNLELGSQSYFTWAQRLCELPQAIFVLALTAATLPTLTHLAARGEEEQLTATFEDGLRIGLFLSIGASGLLLGLAEPIVALLFQRGEFDAVATDQTARALAAQGVGIALLAGVRVISSVFHALGDTRTPLLAAALQLVVFAGLAFGLQARWGHVGIGLAVSGGQLAQFALAWLLVRRRLPKLKTRSVLLGALKTLLLVLAAVVASRTAAQAATLDSAGSLATVLPGVAGGAVFAIVFLLAARLMQSPELALLRHGWRARAR